MNKRILTLLLSSLLAVPAGAASRIAIVDSGTDFEHELLVNKSWKNPNEIPGNLVDDDRNGKVDDVAGWNFAEGTSTLFVRDHLTDINPMTYKFFEIIARMQGGQASDDDKAFWEKNVTSLTPPQKQALLTHLNYFGQYAHGTHVAGIASAQSPDSEIMVGRMFPDEPVRDYAHPGTGSGDAGSVRLFGIVDFLYGLLARLTNASFDIAGGYLSEMKADVANYSLGVGLQMIAKQSLIIRGNKQPTPEQLAAETQRLFKQYEPKGKAWMAKSPETLFVIAAGNDGANNDLFPMYPANVRAPNAISVAASNGSSSLATFSNYGKTMVDLAAPGVAIVSSVPALDRKMTLPMSGTSMAAPYVTGVAGHMKTLNPALNPVALKQILMGTVDVKEWLQDKVISSGIVNANRAYRAAELSRSMSVEEAILEAGKQIQDLPEERLSLSLTGKKSPADLEEAAKLLVF